MSSESGDLLALWNALPNGDRLDMGFATGGCPGHLEGEREVTCAVVVGAADRKVIER
jgi:hypothetical protein